jgi:hypothetical protein
MGRGIVTGLPRIEGTRLLKNHGRWYCGDQPEKCLVCTPKCSRTLHVHDRGPGSKFEPTARQVSDGRWVGCRHQVEGNPNGPIEVFGGPYQEPHVHPDPSWDPR